jgi:hypothetical protein
MFFKRPFCLSNLAKKFSVALCTHAKYLQKNQTCSFKNVDLLYLLKRMVLGLNGLSPHLHLMNMIPINTRL